MHPEVTCKAAGCLGRGTNWMSGLEVTTMVGSSPRELIREGGDYNRAIQLGAPRSTAAQ